MDEWFDAIAIVIGVLVLIALMFAIPVLATLSFCLNWSIQFKFFLTLLFIGEYFTLVLLICMIKK